MQSMAKFDISNPSGFPEFGPAAERKRQEWVHIINGVFEKYGFISVTTPLVEREGNLLGKGGNAKEMYALKRIHDEADDTSHSGNALRFDHTVPLALYVARHFNEISFPFKRAVIGPVFRGERAQKGRFRQFDQCDIDIIGNEKLDIKNDALVVAVIVEIFQQLGIGDFKVKVSNRRILDAFNTKDEIFSELMKALDDLEKIGPDKVKSNLESFGFSPEEALQIIAFTQVSGSRKEFAEKVAPWANNREGVQEALAELFAVDDALRSMGVDEKFYQLDLSIARGLDYYTGTVFETELLDDRVQGSICSGGRYDDLASLFTNKKLPGVGISIGLTRLFAQCLEAGIVKIDKASPTEVLLIAADEVALPKLLELGAELRAAGIVAENYLEKKKLAKQFDYADKLGIPYCVVMGERELAAGEVQVKNMQTGERQEIKTGDLVKLIRSFS